MKIGKNYSLGFDAAAGLLAGILVLLIGLVIWLGNQVGIRVTTQLAAGNTVGPFGPITLVFSEPVDEFLVMDVFYTEPEVEGIFTSVDDRTVRFVPIEPLNPGITYEVGLGEGPMTSEGVLLKKTTSWRFQVRSPLVAYLVADADQSRLWTVEPDTGKTKPITDENFRIFDFDASRDGEFVVFSVFNEQQGIDLWRVNRLGNNLAFLLECGPDRCSMPAISPDGNSVAYVREAAGPNAGLQFGAPRIWILNLKTKQDSPLYEDQQIIGYRPVWSPDGERLSSYDGLADEIRLLDLVTGNQFIVPSQTGSPVSWSADGETLAFTDLATSELGTYTRIREANISAQEIATLFGENDERDYRYNALAWSPVDDKLLIGLQLDENNPAKALLLMDPVTRDGQVIVDQPDYIYNSPKWDPWGKVLIFQQIKLQGVYEPEIGIWEPGWEAPRLLVKGLLPYWLP